MWETTEMETTNRPYRARKNPLQRALYEAAGLRAYAADIEVLDIRARLPGWSARREADAIQAMGIR